MWTKPAHPHGLTRDGITRLGAARPGALANRGVCLQDEARHVAFGRFALREYYPQLTQTERDER